MKLFTFYQYLIYNTNSILINSRRRDLNITMPEKAEATSKSWVPLFVERLKETDYLSVPHVSDSSSTENIDPYNSGASAIGWAPTSANLRVLNATREETAEGEIDKNAHNLNIPKIAELLESAKAKRYEETNKPTIITEVPAISNNVDVAESDVVADVATEEASTPAMPYIDLNSKNDNQEAPAVAEGKTTGANRGFELLTDKDNDANIVVPPVIDASLPSESIQAEDDQAPVATIETAEYDGGPVNVEEAATTKPNSEHNVAIPPAAEPISTVIEVTPPVNEVIEPVENSITVSEAVAPIPSVIPSVEATTPPSAPPVNVETVPAGQAETPPQSVPEMPKGRGILNFFNKLVPKGEARADYFKFAAKVAEGRDKQPAPPPSPVEELKNAA